MQIQYQQQQTPSTRLLDTEEDGTGIDMGYEIDYDDEGKVKLEIMLSQYYGLITRIQIFDEINTIVSAVEEYNNHFKRTYWLLPGSYTVRLEISGQVMDNEIDLGTFTTFGVGVQGYVNLEVPKLYSSVPFSGPLAYETTTPSYLRAAVRISERLRINDETAGDNGIFIFLRYPSERLYRERYRSKSYWQRFDLLDESGNIILQFPHHCTFSDTDGYLGTCFKLAPGSYFLRYRKRKRSRMIPLTVYGGWYTQVFMMLAEEPLFGSLRIFISRENSFDADNELNFYTDVCLDKLQNNDFTLDRYLLEQVASGKFDAPMLGLVGTYMYLKSKVNAENRLFDIIVGNMRQRILSDAATSPDLLALSILQDLHYEKNPDYRGVSYTRTPMLRVAYDAIRRASATNRNLIAWGSLDDYISEKQMFDSPYNTFRAINVRVLRRAYRMESEKLESEKRGREHYLEDSSDLQAIAPRRIAYILETKELSADNENEKRPKATIENAFKRHGSQGAAIFRALTEQPDMRTAELSAMLKLPYTTVDRIREGLKI